MPKPKKGEIYATYNNDFCYEKGLAALRKMEPGIDIQILDYHTIKILLKKKGEALEKAVKSTVQSTKGYVEVELETIVSFDQGILRVVEWMRKNMQG